MTMVCTSVTTNAIGIPTKRNFRTRIDNPRWCRRDRKFDGAKKPKTSRSNQCRNGLILCHRAQNTVWFFLLELWFHCSIHSHGRGAVSVEFNSQLGQNFRFREGSFLVLTLVGTTNQFLHPIAEKGRFISLMLQVRTKIISMTLLLQ